MARHLKPENEVSDIQKLRRKNFKENPTAHIKYLAAQREAYLKTKPKRQFQKKIQMKEKRNEAIKLLGEKCASCGELYNPHAKISNLQFDHKFYIKTKDQPLAPVYAVIYQKNKGIDPNTQFMLLCKTCHMAITHLRKSTEKAKSIVKLATEIGIIKNN